MTYNFDDIYDKIRQYGLTAGRSAAGMALELYFTMVSPQTSMVNKAIISAALAYQFLPRQVLSREKHGAMGVVDNVLTLALAYNRIKASITPEISAQVEAKLNEWGL